MYLQDSQSSIVLRAGDQQIACTRAEFAAIEPDYQPPPDGAARIWSEPVQCLLKDGNQIADPWYTPERLAYFCGKIAQYADALDALSNPQTLWIHHELHQQSGSIIFQADGIPLMRNMAEDVLRVVSSVRVAADPASDVMIQLQQAFPIRMGYADGTEAFIKLITPASPGVYQYDLHFAGKAAVRYRVFDDSFASIDLSGVSYAFQQVTPLIIDVYEP